MKTLFKEEKIEYFGALPFSFCRCRRPDLVERQGVQAGDIRTAVLFLIPYYVKDSEEGNLSLYARSADYHLYCDALFDRMLPELEKRYGGRFLGFADKSPIEENIAASMAGLGRIGDNYMIINETYGSFVFIGEILTTVPPEMLGFPIPEAPAPSYCLHCGACKKACPMGTEHDCLSAVTQKKGTLSEAESRYLRTYGSVWGCDICQLVCPYNKEVIWRGTETPIAFFRKDRIARLDLKLLEHMDDTEFSRRAFSWRGRAVLERNLAILNSEYSE